MKRFETSYSGWAIRLIVIASTLLLLGGCQTFEDASVQGIINSARDAATQVDNSGADDPNGLAAAARQAAQELENAQELLRSSQNALANQQEVVNKLQAELAGTEPKPPFTHQDIGSIAWIRYQLENWQDHLEDENEWQVDEEGHTWETKGPYERPVVWAFAKQQRVSDVTQAAAIVESMAEKLQKIKDDPYATDAEKQAAQQHYDEAVQRNQDIIVMNQQVLNMPEDDQRSDEALDIIAKMRKHKWEMMRKEMHMDLFLAVYKKQSEIEHAAEQLTNLRNIVVESRKKVSDAAKTADDATRAALDLVGQTTGVTPDYPNQPDWNSTFWDFSSP